MVERISRSSCSASNRSDTCMREPHLPAGCAPAGASPPVTGWASLSSPVESQIPKMITAAAPRRIGAVPHRSCDRLRRLRGLFTSLSWRGITLSVARQRPRCLQVGLDQPRFGRNASLCRHRRVAFRRAETKYCVESATGKPCRPRPQQFILAIGNRHSADQIQVYMWTTAGRPLTLTLVELHAGNLSVGFRGFMGGLRCSFRAGNAGFLGPSKTVVGVRKLYRPTWSTSAEVEAIAAIRAHLAAACRVSVRVPASRCAMICWSNLWVSAMLSFI